jgi:hypothetical protein
MKQRSSSSHSQLSSSSSRTEGIEEKASLDGAGSGGAAHVAVIVLGDTGRSPRMQYHALSFSSLNPLIGEVTLIGYAGERCNDLIQSQPNIRDLRSAKREPEMRPLFLSSSDPQNLDHKYFH